MASAGDVEAVVPLRSFIDLSAGFFSLICRFSFGACAGVVRGQDARPIWSVSACLENCPGLVLSSPRGPKRAKCSRKSSRRPHPGWRFRRHRPGSPSRMAGLDAFPAEDVGYGRLPAARPLAPPWTDRSWPAAPPGEGPKQPGANTTRPACPGRRDRSAFNPPARASRAGWRLAVVLAALRLTASAGPRVPPLLGPSQGRRSGPRRPRSSIRGSPVPKPTMVAMSPS